MESSGQGAGEFGKAAVAEPLMGSAGAFSPGRFWKGFSCGPVKVTIERKHCSGHMQSEGDR